MSLCCVGLGAELGYVWECPDVGQGVYANMAILFIYLFIFTSTAYGIPK